MKNSEIFLGLVLIGLVAYTMSTPPPPAPPTYTPPIMPPGGNNQLPNPEAPTGPGRN